MTNTNFNKCIDNILEDKQIENIPLDNIDILRDLLYHKRLNKKFYKGFKNNYELEYGDDLDYLVMKVQDFVYRLHLLVNNIISNEQEKVEFDFIYNTICTFLENNSISFYDAVSYDSFDNEIIEEQELTIKESLGLR